MSAACLSCLIRGRLDFCQKINSSPDQPGRQRGCGSAQVHRVTAETAQVSQQQWYSCRQYGHTILLGEISHLLVTAMYLWFYSELVIVLIDMIIIALVTFLACMARVGEGLGVEVEDVTGRQLEAALETENLLAVMFCKFTYLFSKISQTILEFYIPTILEIFPLNETSQPTPDTTISLFSFQCYHRPECLVSNLQNLRHNRNYDWAIFKEPPPPMMLKWLSSLSHHPWKYEGCSPGDLW